MSVESEAPDAAAVLDGLLGRAGDLLRTADRNDLADRVQAARVRASRPTTVVCVVGEFKQGKSSLVNALIGQQLCPVDDDIATAALTLVRYGEQPGAVVRYAGDADPRAEQVAVDEVAAYVTDRANTGDRRVERVDVMVPSALLADGLALVDSPGMGGLGAGHAAATLSFLPFADGLVFVSDSSNELTAPELDFLTTARERCPDVVMASTKTDITPEWRRIVDIDRGHLDTRGLDIPIVPVSAALRQAAFDARDRELNARSGIPDLITALADRIIAPAKAGAGARAANESAAMIRATASMLQAEAEALDDPDAAERLRQQAAEAGQRLESLRSGSARWQTVLGDRVTDLSTEVTHRMRGSLRETSRGIEEQIEQLKTPQEWDGLARTLQAEVGEAVAQAFTAVELARGEIRAELAELLAADDVVGPTRTRDLQILDTTQMWRSRDLDPSESGGGKAFRTGITGLRGAQGGVLMLGVSGQFLPAAASVFIASNPVLLGAGALFGGFQLVEDRKRKLQARRQAARTQLRQFTDDVQFEVGNELTGLIRSVQRDLRDEFVELIGELQQSWTAAAKQAHESASQGERATAERLTAVRSLLERCNALAAELEAAGEESS